MTFVIRIFFYVKVDDVDKDTQYLVETIKGIRDMHLVIFCRCYGCEHINGKELVLFLLLLSRW
jgi:hypothetical protein